MVPKILYSIVATFITMTNLSFADKFNNTDISAWADTPAGKFECKTTKDHRQVLFIEGKEIYRTPDHLKGRMGEAGAELLSQGIYLDPLMVSPISACPNIVENKAGYVVYEEEIAPEISGNPIVDEAFPPVEGLVEYTIINFNAIPATLIKLYTQGERREGKKYQPRFTWDAHSFMMRYYGYPYCKKKLIFYSKYLKAKFHTIRFDFASQIVTIID